VTDPKAWKVVESELVVNHRFIQARDDLIEHPDDGRRYHCLYFEGPSDAVATVALTDDGCVILTRQYRHPIKQVIYDLPAGSPNPGETPQQGAARWRKLTYFNQFPGAMRVGTHLFLAQDLTPGEQDLDRFEDLAVVKMPFEKALMMVTQGRIIDGSMIVGLLLAAQKGLAAT
jgi:ADP-ribose pyrophosphatase